jgi:hypothetical protein
LIDKFDGSIKFSKYQDLKYKQSVLVKNLQKSLQKFDIYKFNKDNAFYDLLSKMLALDPSERITPE